jgi:hypothetical protein
MNFFFLKKKLRFYSRSIFLKIESAGLTIQDPARFGRGKKPYKEQFRIIYNFHHHYILLSILIFKSKKNIFFTFSYHCLCLWPFPYTAIIPRKPLNYNYKHHILKSRFLVYHRLPVIGLRRRNSIPLNFVLSPKYPFH